MPKLKLHKVNTNSFLVILKNFSIGAMAVTGADGQFRFYMDNTFKTESLNGDIYIEIGSLLNKLNNKISIDVDEVSKILGDNENRVVAFIHTIPEEIPDDMISSCFKTLFIKNLGPYPLDDPRIDDSNISFEVFNMLIKNVPDEQLDKIQETIKNIWSN